MEQNFTETVDSSFYQNFYCKLFIKGVPLIPQNIVFMAIRTWIFDISPRLELTFNDDGAFVEVFTLEDNDQIVVELAKDNADENPIIMDFLLQDYSIVQIADNKGFSITLTGILNSKELYFPIRTKSFRNKTSVDVVRDICSNSNLNFVTSIKTNDLMTWLQINQSNYDFLRHIKDRAYKPNDSIFIYTDLSINKLTKNHNLVMTSLNTKISQQSIRQARYDLEKSTISTFENEIDREVIWYNYLDINNFSGYLNKVNNYGLGFNYYNLKENKSISVFNNVHEFTDLSFKDKSGVNKIVVNNNYGIVNNVFKDYYLAILQNDYLSKNFFPFTVLLNVNSISKVNLFDRLLLTMQGLPNLPDQGLNEFYSGSYLVMGIVLSVSKGSILRKQIILGRNGFNKSNIYQKEYSVA